MATGGTSTGPARAGDRRELLVSAAVSLKAPLSEIAFRFEALERGSTVVLNTGASGVLVAQIERGAPVGVFVSASPHELDRLEGAGRIRPGSRITVASNRLRVVVPAGSDPPARLTDLAEERFARIALGNPRTVPAGRYAIRALEAAGLLDALRPRLVPAENARHVLEYVARGEVEAGLVYGTDAVLLRDRVVEGPWADLPGESGIAYQAAIPVDAPDPALATSFLSFLAGEDAREVLERHGFGSPSAGSRTR